MKKIIFSILIGLTSTVAMAARTISGTVTDEAGEPLIGAHVRPPVKTDCATTTDLDGKFTLNCIPDNAAELLVSYVSYESKTITLNNATNVYNIFLDEAHTLSETVVTGSFTSKPCSDAELRRIHAKSGHTEQRTSADPDETAIKNDKGEPLPIKCVPDSCEISYKLVNGKCDAFTCDKTQRLNETKNECESLVGKSCLQKDAPNDTRHTTDTNATKAEFAKNSAGTDLICEIKNCVDHYVPNDAKNACIQSDGPCTDAQIAAIENATKGELRKTKCYATECKAGFEPIDGKCVSFNGKPCDKLPENATAGERKMLDGKEVCHVTACKENFAPTADGLACEHKLTQEQSAERVKELEKNYNDMRAKEQSTENKMIGAAGIGAVGIGGMQLASAMSEQRSDEQAEQDMKAYLATFRCTWGGGQTVRGGETDVVLGGAGTLTNLYSEYMQLAADLKARKEALDLKPGIESEVVLNSANTGLYDDVGIGKTGGAFTSLSRALMDENGDDAAAWAAQKDATAQKLKTGATVAGIGAIGSLAANLAVNSGKGAAKERSAEINSKYDDIMRRYKQAVQQSFDNVVSCPTGQIGAHPNCSCPNANQYYADNGQGCVTCPADQKPNADATGCTCNDTTKKLVNGRCIAENQCPNKNDTHYDATSPDCGCISPWSPNGAKCVCPSATHRESNGTCTPLQITSIKANVPQLNIPEIKLPDLIPVDVLTPRSQVLTDTIIVGTTGLFNSGQYTMDSTKQTNLINSLKTSIREQQGDFDILNCTIDVTGYTDPYWANVTEAQGAQKNIELSQKRAAHMAEVLSRAFASNSNYKVNAGVGAGQANCKCGMVGDGDGPWVGNCAGKPKGYEITWRRGYKPCRRIEITVNCNTTKIQTEQ